MVKGMKQTEIGWIPEDWEVKKLGSIAFITKLAGFEYSKHFNSYKDGGEIIVVRGTNITNNKLDLTDTKYIPRKVSDFLYRSKLSKGDLVFAYVGTIGPIYLIGENDRFHLGPNTAKIRIEDKDVSTRFIYNYFLSEFIRKEIDDRISVGAQPSLSMTKIRDFSLPLPPLPEQEAIARALSDADAWIESLEQLIAKKRLIKQGTMQELLTQKEGWEVKKLGEVIEILADYTANGSFESLKNNVRYYSKKNYAVLVRTTDLDKKEFEPERFTDEIGYRFLSKTSLFGGELILANVGSIGKVFKVPKYNMPMTLAPNTYMIKLFSSFSQEYVYQWMKSGEFVTKLLAKVGSSTLMAINKNNLRDIIIPIPNTYSEQTRIATILSDMDAQLAALEAQLHKARQIKQGMMQELLTGRIRLEL